MASTTDLLGGRVQWYSVDLLNGAGKLLSSGFSVDSMSLTLDNDNLLEANGSIQWKATSTQSLLNNLVRIWYCRQNHDPQALATLVPRIPRDDHSDAIVNMNVDLYDRCCILDEDSFGYTYGIDTGVAVIAKVKEIIASTGDTYAINIPIPDTGDPVLSAAMSFDASVSKLEIVNKLLAAIGYRQLRTDAMGVWVSTLKVLPGNAPVTWAFTHLNGQGVYLSRYQVSRDDYGVPNRYVGTRKVSGSAPADRAVALDYTSPFGFNARGRWITAPVETDIDAVDFATLQAIVKQRLIDRQQVAQTISVQTPWLPIRTGQITTFESPRVSQMRAQVLRQQYSSSARLVQLDLRQVVGTAVS